MRGYQKKVIYMKNTGSDIFEEAYFVVKSDTPPSVGSHERMVDEANRIINENFDRRKSKFLIGVRGKIGAFLLGSLLSSIVFLVFKLL